MTDDQRNSILDLFKQIYITSMHFGNVEIAWQARMNIDKVDPLATVYGRLH